MYIENAPAAPTSSKLERMAERFTASSLFRNGLLIASGLALVSLAGVIIASASGAIPSYRHASSTLETGYGMFYDCAGSRSSGCAGSVEVFPTLDATASTQDPGAALSALAKALPRDGSTYQVIVKVTKDEMARPATKELN